MTVKPDRKKTADDTDVVLKRVRRSRRRGRLGFLFIGTDSTTGKEVRWWCVA